MRRGFSLVELSIVLVILGLLVGGILAGQSLIRASELRAVGTEATRWQTAVQAFRDKYFAIPGDMLNGTAFWGRMTTTGCVTNSGASVNAGTGVCDGDANGSVDNSPASSAPGETFQFWRSLAVAGLIEGIYDGRAGSAAGTHAIIGTNVPASRLANAGWSLRNLGLYSDGSMYRMNYGHLFFFGGNSPAASTTGLVLTPAEAWNIDTKLDDGKPAYGTIIARGWNNGCAAADDGNHTNSNLAASYKLSDTTLQCGLHWIRQF